MPNGNYIYVLIDQYSRYPIVEFTTSTLAKYLVPTIDKVLATQGFPDTVKTDRRPPFNGNGSHQYQMYMKWTGVKTKVVTSEDPEVNRITEIFLKVLTKICHISLIEDKNPQQDINKFLHEYRTTIHTTRGIPPAGVLFNRPFKIRLPEHPEVALRQDLWQQNDAAKQLQKHYKDQKKNVRPHNIQEGDNMLLLQKKKKSKPQYEPIGTQTTTKQGDEIRIRDA